jgi:hypothetical protein
MTRAAVTILVLAISAAPAVAAPGDPRIVQGTLEWPATLAAEPFVVVRGDDSHVYYADIASAQRRMPAGLTAGSRIALLGVEGNRPHEVAVMVIGAGDAASLGVDTSNLPPPAPTAPSEPMWRVDGTVQGLSGRAVTLQTPDGQTATVDVSRLSTATVVALRPGERVSLFGVPRDDRQLVANGYIQVETAPAASPRTGP